MHDRNGRLLASMAKRPSWYLNAARRTLLTAIPQLAKPDDRYAAGHLSPAEFELFCRLGSAEREHAVAVARKVQRLKPAVRSEVLRAALLHDVGKLGSSSNVVFRVVAHLLPNGALPPEPRLTGLAGTRQAAQHHADYGRGLILAAGGDPEVARLVSAHHDGGSDEEARLIRECDELT